MNSIRPLTPFERGQAALADCLAHTDWAPDSDERLQWVAGLLTALDGMQVPAAAVAPEAIGAAAKAHDLERVLVELTHSLAPVIGAHLRGDAVAVHAALVGFVRERCKVVHHSAGSGVLQ